MTERNLIQGKFRELLYKYTDFASLSKDKCDTIIRRLERSCFNSAIDIAQQCGVPALFSDSRFVNTYSTECMRILSNIDKDTAYNSFLVDKIISGDIDISNITSLKNENLNPEVSQKERDDIATRQNQKTDVKVSRKYTCRKCGENKTIPVDYQGRAIDEASSKSIKCIECGETQ